MMMIGKIKLLVVITYTHPQIERDLVMFVYLQQETGCRIFMYNLGHRLIMFPIQKVTNLLLCNWNSSFYAKNLILICNIILILVYTYRIYEIIFLAPPLQGKSLGALHLSLRVVCGTMMFETFEIFFLKNRKCIDHLQL